MLYTREWVEEKYNYYNDLIWGGQLPSFNRINFKITMDKKRWGCAGTDSWGRDIDGIPYARTPVLKLSNYLDAPEWAKLNTLVHEMCHLYELFCEPKYILEVFRYNRYTYNYPKHGHGKVFYEQAQRVEQICGIEITRFVSDERLASATVSDSVKDKAKQKIKSNGGIDIILVATVNRTKNGGKYAYCKPSPKALNEWQKFLKTDNAKKYFIAASHCKSFSLEVEHLPSSRTICWYGINDVQEFVNKYQIEFGDTYMGTTNDFGLEQSETQNKETSIEPEIKAPTESQEKRYRQFMIKFTSGKVLKFTNVTKEEVAQKLRQEFPKWPDATIEKIINNNELYTENKMEKKHNIDYLTERIVGKELRKKFRNNENDDIPPFSDEEMKKLQGGFIINN